MAVPATSWSELSPADSDLRSVGDDAIRLLKAEIREIMNVDHHFPTAAEDPTGQGLTWGCHDTLTLHQNAYAQTSAGSSLVLYLKYLSPGSGLFMSNGTTTTQLTKNTDWIGGFTNEIRMWSGSTADIPSGWKLCSGLIGTGTLALLSKFIRGSSTVGTTGGTNTGYAYSYHIPAHTHAVSGGTTHTHELVSAWGSGATPAFGGMTLIYMAESSVVSGYIEGTGTHTHSYTTNSAATSTWNNMPAYYKLAFIQRSSTG